MSGHDRRYAWTLAFFLFWAGAINYADRTAVSAVFPLLRTDLGVTDVQLGLIGSVFLWSYAACSPVMGFLGDRFSHSRIILWSLAGWSAVTAATAASTTFPQLLAARAMLGVTESAYLPSANALLSHHHPPETRATALSVHSAGLNFGLIAGGTLAGYLADRAGWRAGFVLLGAAGIALAVAGRFVFRLPPAAAGRTGPVAMRTTLANVLRVPTYWFLVGEGVSIAVGQWIFNNWLPLYFKETFDMSLAAAGFSGTFALQGAAVAGTFAGGVLSDRLARNQTRRRLILMGVLHLLSAPFLLAFLVKAPGIALISASTFLFSFIRAMGLAGQVAVICEVLPPASRSTGIGFLNTFNTFAGGLGVLAAGMLKSDWGLSGVFAAVSLFSLVAAGCAVGACPFVQKDLRRTGAGH